MDLCAAVTNLPSKKETNVMEKQNKIKLETISTITEPKKKKRKDKPFAFKLGDKVCISHLRSAFQREHDVKWSGKIWMWSFRNERKSFSSQKSG